MKKTYTFFLLLFGFSLIAKADHITGGEMYYTFLGISNGQYQYSVTLKLFMRCNSGRQFNNPTIVSVFDRATNSRVSDINVALSNSETLSYNNTNLCITNPPVVCYVVGYYQFTLSLPGSTEGYLLASQVNYRIAGISNLANNYGLIGATYTTEIPATNASENNSARFSGNDLVVVCANNSFSYSFAAEDKDGDKLRYTFCNAYQSTGGGFGNNNISPPDPPPYQPIPYGSVYSGSSPLGNNVKINSNTGLITGIAPAPGKYVVTVCVEEIRNGITIATQRKDLQINIADCFLAAASLLPDYMLCRDTKTITVSNFSNSPLIKSYNWEFINDKNATIFTSTSPTISYTFPDTGIYKIKLFINEGMECSDSGTTLARVYPGFVPAFNFTGICVNKPTQFINTTTTVYGQTNSWNWDFGETTTTDDVSDQQNPVYTYPGEGIKNARLIVSNTLGCVDTIIKAISIVDRPPITLAFADALICTPDAIRLTAGGSGNFSWSPAANIIDAGTATPTVSPPVTTTYFVDLNDNGCVNRDSVRIRVVDHVSLQAMSDTTICEGDAIQLHLVSDGLEYSWTPVSQLADPHIADPVAVINSTSTYEVIAKIGSCSAKDEVIITTIPYPVANAGADTIICYNTSAQLSASINGSSFSWSPVTAFNNTAVLNPVVSPAATTAYVLSVYDTKGCPKPGLDTVSVIVLPDINPFAGGDTAVVVGQPLQLKASGGIKYLWIPANDLSDANIPNPVAVYNEPVESIRYKVMVYNEAGCADSAFMQVKVFKTLPSVFVPNAFTPNGDGKNDIFRPVAAGMQQMEYFRVYNRWGQLVFSTSSNSKGWDGTFNGKPQDTGVFVWMVKAIDYTGASYFKKGTVTLIR